MNEYHKKKKTNQQTILYYYFLTSLLSVYFWTSFSQVVSNIASRYLNKWVGAGFEKISY